MTAEFLTQGMSSTKPAAVRIGTAGWALPAVVRGCFGEGASNLARYASRFDCVEINSSFHRRHRPSTWARWAESVPDGFRFSAKLPKTISHGQRLADCDALLAEFLDDVSGLGAKLAVILVQLPPSLAFDALVAPRFLAALAEGSDAQITFEPRHPSWFEPAPDALLRDLRIARVAADPATVPAAAVPGGWSGLAYWRLHGSPRIYRSSYEEERIATFAAAIGDAGVPAWCIFDNTASSAATGNALDLADALR